MNSDRLVGCTALRVSAVGFAAASLGAAYALYTGLLPEWSFWLRTALFAGVLLSLVAGVHWSAGIYRRWMWLAGVINTVSMTVIFGLCYLFLVPMVAVIIHMRRLRSGNTTQSAWVVRPNRECDGEYLQRMG
jgi:hypothetical protein